MEITQMILIIIVQRFRLEMTEICHAPDTYGMIIKVILLKKKSWRSKMHHIAHN
jgi:hypothetical protein